MFESKDVRLPSCNHNCRVSRPSIDRSIHVESRTGGGRQDDTEARRQVGIILIQYEDYNIIIEVGGRR